MNFLNCAFVTSVSSIQKELISTLCFGYSSLLASSLSPPIKNFPPSMNTIPSFFNSLFFVFNLLSHDTKIAVINRKITLKIKLKCFTFN